MGPEKYYQSYLFSLYSKTENYMLCYRFSLGQRLYRKTLQLLFKLMKFINKYMMTSS